MGNRRNTIRVENGDDMIHRKGDRKDCNNYRETTLLNVAYEIFTNCILSKMKETTKN